MAEKKEDKRENWADLSDADEGADDQNADAPFTRGEESKKTEQPKPVRVPNAKKGIKNVRGDYIVTKIEIPDIKSKKDGENKNKESEEESSSDEGYGEEDEK